MYNHRQFCYQVGKEIAVEESVLNIFYTDPMPKSVWVPHRQLKPYNELKQVVIDIETTGLDRQCDRIIAIGCLRESGDVQIFMQEDEAFLLQEFLDYLNSVNPEVLLTYNGLTFDLPFLMARLDSHVIKHPFRRAEHPRKIQSAQRFGTPIEIWEIFYKSANHVDIYTCVLRWDFIAKSLNLSYSIKNVALEMGLRKTPRLNLSHQQIQDCWNQRKWEIIREYLRLDLEDTKLIGDKLVPSYWYEALVVPGMNLQSLSLPLTALSRLCKC